ncbi:MAG: phosphoribosylglycinamide formyltransferase [Ferruginibacter sp.]
MLNKLREKWGINSRRFFLVLCTFAVTGSFTAWIGNNISNWLNVERYTLAWWIFKIAVFGIGYQVLILFFGFCFGQFAFFWNFEKRLLAHLGFIKKTSNIHLAIFASGAGSNAKKIIEYFKGSPDVRIVLIVSSNPNAGILDIAKEKDIESFICGKGETPATLLNILEKKKVNYLILAGYLKIVPPAIIKAFPKKIINLHPALLPSYGGKGMYGLNVHEAVINNKEKESGITIHFADELYDHGEIIFQEKCAVNENETPATLAAKIQALEHIWYSQVISSIIKKQNSS